MAISMSSCRNGKFYPAWAKPLSLDIADAPEGSPIYQQGYRDGCESGFKGYSQPYNKVWWKFRQDPKLRGNPVYYKIWKDAYSYCAAYALSASMNGIGNVDKSGIWQ
jgi:hypothetical protein